ncbi:MAG: winged helix-turn-helix domain-containing protein [Acidimicrobiales bacterium]
MNVVLLRWPSERIRLERLRVQQLPRLLLIEPGGVPPESTDCLEDWMRMPVDDIDLQLRTRALAVRADQHVSLKLELEDGVLRHGGAWVSLPPVEARITQVLLDRMGTVVSRDTLAQSGWPQGAPGRNALDVHVLRLRRRLQGVGLTIRTVRSRGYLIELTDG